MNVYAIKAAGIYGAGMAVVVAEIEEQAKSLASTLSRANAPELTRAEGVGVE